MGEQRQNYSRIKRGVERKAQEKEGTEEEERLQKHEGGVLLLIC